MPLGQVTGDFDKLAKLHKGLEKLGREGYRMALQLAAGRVSRLVERGFDTGTAPDGSRWKPNQAGTQTLVGRNGWLREDARSVAATPYGLKASSDLPYANAHLHGYAPRNLQPRPYLPQPDFASLPPKWKGAITGGVEAVLKTYLPPWS